MPLLLEAWSLNHWTAREVPCHFQSMEKDLDEGHLVGQRQSLYYNILIVLVMALSDKRPA